MPALASEIPGDFRVTSLPVQPGVLLESPSEMSVLLKKMAVLYDSPGTTSKFPGISHAGVGNPTPAEGRVRSGGWQQRGITENYQMGGSKGEST